MNYKLGAYFGWKWIFIGYSIDMKNLFSKNKVSDQRTEFALSLYSSIVGCDLYYRKSGNAFKLRNMSDFFPEGYSGKIDKNINGFSVDIAGLNAYWILNHKRFSYPAAYSQSTNQKRNAGSIIVGFSFSTHKINFDYEKLPIDVQTQLDDGLKFRKLTYSDYSLSAGYTYNWVFARNCLACLSLTPAIAYKASDVDAETHEGKTWYGNFNLDFLIRAGVVYNNGKYFVGTSFVGKNYNYHRNNFSLDNGFGTLQIYVGFNFNLRKEYRRKNTR